MNRSSRVHFAALAALGVLWVGLVGCRALPLPIEIDLLPELGEARAGVVEEAVRSGPITDFLLDLPEHEDSCLNVGDDQLPVSVVHAQVTYEIDLHYAGPELSGVIEAQPYLASSRSQLWTATTALGDPVTTDLASTRAKLRGVARLTAEQVRALNERRLCWALRLQGTDVGAATDGTIRATYEVRTLSIRAGVAVF